MVKLQVRLHSGTATFLAGEQVNGEVIARVDSPTKARRIYVEVYGCAFNKWYGQDEYEYEAKVQFLNVILLLWKPSDGSVGVIQPGNYCFPFSFVIPPNALPNHENWRYGFDYRVIDYWCKAYVDRPWHTNDEFIIPFVVANIVDLNAITSSLNPVRRCFEEKLGCCSGNGALRAEISIDKFGYVGGEYMLLCIDIENASSENVRTIQIRVVEEWTYQAYIKIQRWTPKSCEGRQESRCFTRDLLSFKEAVMIEPQYGDRYERRIQLLAVQPSYGCKITVHNFYVQVVISTDGFFCSSTLCGRVPFYVGNVPLRSAQALSPSGKSTIITNEVRNAAIRNVVQDVAADDVCC